MSKLCKELAFRELIVVDNEKYNYTPEQLLLKVIEISDRKPPGRGCLKACCMLPIDCFRHQITIMCLKLTGIFWFVVILVAVLKHVLP